MHSNAQSAVSSSPFSTHETDPLLSQHILSGPKMEAEKHFIAAGSAHLLASFITRINWGRRERNKTAERKMAAES